MIKKILVIGLWVVAIGLWMPIVIPQNTNPYQELYDEVLAPVVKITSQAGTGSGVVISHRRDAEDAEGIYILSAAHVVGNESEVQVIVYSYRRDAEFAEIFNGTVIITDTNKDLALLRITQDARRRVHYARLAPRDYKPYLFTPVYAVGCSLGFDPRPSEGILSASAMNHWEISAPILPGNSGGGVFLKNTHELIGIAVWIRTYHGQLVTTMAGIVPINQIYEFLSVVPRGGLGADLTRWSGRGSECAIGTRGPGGPTLLMKGGEKTWR